jgi:hypothetical protein
VGRSSRAAAQADVSYSLIVLPAAAENLAEALQARELPSRRPLLAEITAIFEKIRERPRRFPLVYAETHRALTPRFHFVTGDNETCTTTNTAASDYYVMVRGYAAFSGVSLVASY